MQSRLFQCCHLFIRKPPWIKARGLCRRRTNCCCVLNRFSLLGLTAQGLFQVLIYLKDNILYCHIRDDILLWE